MYLNPAKIVVTGGPSTGKTSIISDLEKSDEICMHEVSRVILKEAKKNGTDNLFLDDPLLFSNRLLQGRIQQFNNASLINSSRIFLDRGIPDIIAYLDFINEKVPSGFIEASQKHIYDQVFILPPWREIYTGDTERYETYDQSKRIYQHLLKTYSDLGYDCIEVPKGSLQERIDFLITHASHTE